MSVLIETMYSDIAPIHTSSAARTWWVSILEMSKPGQWKGESCSECKQIPRVQLTCMPCFRWIQSWYRYDFVKNNLQSNMAAIRLDVNHRHKTYKADMFTCFKAPTDNVTVVKQATIVVHGVTHTGTYMEPQIPTIKNIDALLDFYPKSSHTSTAWDESRDKIWQWLYSNHKAWLE